MPSNAIAQPPARLRQQHALDLRINGHTYAEIATKLGYADPSTARGAILALLRRSESDLADHWRSIETARLEKLIATWLPLATGTEPSVKAAEVVLRTHQALVRLHGAELAPAATVVVATNPVEVVEQARSQLHEIAQRHQPPTVDGEVVEADGDADSRCHSEAQSEQKPLPH